MSRKPTLSRRIPTAVAVAAGALLALPASGMAAETFGSQLTNSPNYGACADKDLPAPCSWVSYIHPSAPNGDPYAGGAPNDGVITRFRIRAYGAGGIGTPASVTFRVAEISLTNPDSAQARAVGTGPTVQIAGTGEVEEFPGRLPVSRGEHLAIDTTDAHAVYETGGNKFTYGYGPVLVDGAAARTSTTPVGELLVAAVVEPDADGDGFGDETQDRCAGESGSDNGCDNARPALTGLKMAPRGGKKAIRRVRYRLSEPARVTLRVQRRVGGRYVTRRGRVVKNGKAGLNRTKLRMRIGGRKLPAGRYRLTAVARDAAGNRSTVKRLRFRVRR
ncbi:MAG TPA: hypothetical protein VHF90_09435 [Thermoleophilaceae bacterium]|nr:hypothetical protein [Thermoleophilaceae bacterium]